MQTRRLDEPTLAYLDRELELIVQLGDEQVVAQRLPHLHDPDDGSVDLVLPVLEHALRGADLLLHLRERARRLSAPAPPPWGLLSSGWKAGQTAGAPVLFRGFVQ